jgi:hypothetical protein
MIFATVSNPCRAGTGGIHSSYAWMIPAALIQKKGGGVRHHLGLCIANSKIGLTDASSSFKLVQTGDGACGKTCLLIVFSKGMFPEVSIDNDLATTLYLSR